MPRRRRDDPDAPELDVHRIVTAAIELIDQHGLEDFSLRSLARSLGAGNMSLYYYVEDRDHLLALVLDEVLGSISLRRLPAEPVEALSLLARRFVAAFTAHPGAIPLFVLQPPYSIGPNGASVFDRFIGLLRDTGLPDDEVAYATVALVEYLCGHLIGHLPEMRRSGEDVASLVDDVLASLPDSAAPNIRALGPQLRTAVSTLDPTVGIAILLAGIGARASSTTSVRRGRPTTPAG